MKFSTVIACLAVAGAALAGCSGDDSPLDDRVAAVRAAVAAGDRSGAERALDELAFATGVAVNDGSIGDAEGQEIAGLIASSRTLLDEVLSTTTTTTTTTSTTAAPDKDGKGKKKGHEDEDDDD